VLYTGRLVERKGIRDLLDAIPPVLEQFPDTRFVLAGGPAGWDAKDLPRQWLPPECLPFADRIHFTGWLATQEVDEWYRRADIQVIPSRYEPFGMVVLEGMLHGLPIIATSVGGP
jgi:glycosyltransferase involved in cell wall biosynthesis